MRRIILALCMSLLAAVVFSGCKQQCFMTECDYNYYMDRGIAQLENDPTISIVPATSDSPAPATVLNPEREIRYLTLREAIATALENGSPGTTFLPDPLGNYNDSLIGASRGTINNEDSIRAFSYDPAILGAEIEKSLSKFDAYMVSGIQWFTTDQPVGSAIQTIQALGRRDIQQDNAQVFAGVYKQLPTGGTAGIGFSTNYQLSNLAQRVNPAYQPNLAFSFSQPLLQGYGVEINQLRRFHPGLTNFENQAISRALGGFGLLPSFPGSQSAEGILLTRVTFDQSRAEFERNLNIMITNVEVAYWNLYGAYWTLYSREQALRQGYETWRIVKAAYEAGRTAIQDYAQARQQYELFRGQRLAALGEVLEKERDLRGFMGLPAEDGYRLVPIDTPHHRTVPARLAHGSQRSA
ncbi:MAG: hypothetical protein KatS3mg105_2404 [Gemmatales bacterium]|nr:MAG: hypothetical protein KatS3mg105_2404 [Gemmatales bacterium]